MRKGKGDTLLCLMGLLLMSPGEAFAQSSNGAYSVMQDGVSSGGGTIGGGNPMQAQTVVGLPAGGMAGNATYELLGGLGTSAAGAGSGTATVTVTGSVDDSTATVTVNGVAAALSGMTYTASLQLPVGAHTLTAVATDPAGNQGSASVTVTVANPAPPPMPTVGTVGTAPPAVTTDNALTLGGTKTAGTSIWINGQQVVAADSATTWTASLNLAEGDNAVSIVAKDAAGSASAAVSLTIVRDAQPPVITFTPPAKTNFTPALLAGTVDDSLTTVTVNGIAAARNGLAFEASVPLVLGANTITVQATSPNNYTATATATVTRGTIPSITAVAPADGAKAYLGQPLTIQITATDQQNDPIEYQVLVDGQPLGGWSAANAQSWTPGASEAGVRALRAKVRDAYGGENAMDAEVCVVRPPISHP